MADPINNFNGAWLSLFSNKKNNSPLGNNNNNSLKRIWGIDMDPLIGASLLQTGGGILGGLASYFGGADERKKRAQLYKLGLGMLGKDVFNPTQYLSQYSQGLGSQMSPYEARVQRRFGLDSGVGASEVLRARQGLLSNFLTEGYQTNALAKSQRDQNILGLLSGLYRG